MRVVRVVERMSCRFRFLQAFRVDDFGRRSTDKTVFDISCLHCQGWSKLVDMGSPHKLCTRTLKPKPSLNL